MADPLANRPHASLPLDVGIVYRDAFFQATYIIFGKTTILPEAGDGDDTTSTAEHVPCNYYDNNSRDLTALRILEALVSSSAPVRILFSSRS